MHPRLHRGARSIAVSGALWQCRAGRVGAEMALHLRGAAGSYVARDAILEEAWSKHRAAPCLLPRLLLDLEEVLGMLVPQRSWQVLKLGVQQLVHGLHVDAHVQKQYDKHKEPIQKYPGYIL